MFNEEDGSKSKIEISVIIARENNSDTTIKLSIFLYLKNISTLPITVESPAIKDNNNGIFIIYSIKDNEI